jgi:hypothetical protein
MRFAEIIALILMMAALVLFGAGCTTYADRTRPIHLDVEGVPLPSVLWAIDTWQAAGVTFTLDEAPQTVTIRATELPPEIGGNDDGKAIVISTPWPPNIAHELGHSIGIGHIRGCGIMSPTPCRSGDDFELTAEDFEELARE